ncbi:hypothetical protein Hypma_016618 [Hypsizygus marmoreus]|uniref:F-box domain-containing protein n=1 Tax=Hypsizygus marmoreus TaxID=39966 RepID=A0A369J4R3_HYPMA|nr:hypothetical protein Hypma_016618 [Hypsizygus marmoreus]
MPTDIESVLQFFFDQVKKDIENDLTMMNSCPHHRIFHAQRISESLESKVDQLETFKEQVGDVHDWLLSQQIDSEERLFALDTHITSPFRRLSRELIARILSHFLNADGISLISVRQNITQTPLVLGQICHLWREVALSIPTLWSALHVEFPQNIAEDEELKMIGLVKLWMERSRDAPLTVRVTIFLPARHYLGLRGSSVRAVFEPLLQHSDRWKDVHLDLSFEALKALVKDRPFTSTLRLPHLETFKLTGGRESSDVERLTRFPFHPHFNLSSAPRLMKVSLLHIGLFAASEPAFPWQSLNELYLVGMHHEVSSDDCHAILRQCGALRRCRLSITNSSRSPGQVEGQLIRLDALEWLHITEHSLSGGGGGDIYHRLICPNLWELILEYLPKESEIFHQHHSIWTRDAIISFLSHSPSLMALQLWNMPMSERCLIKVLSRVPSITHLTLAGWRPIHCVGNSLLHRLTFAEVDEMLLQDLEYIDMESQAFTWFYIIDFLESRIRFADTLRFVRLCSPEMEPLNAGQLLQLATYEKEGLVVEMVKTRVGEWDS